VTRDFVLVFAAESAFWCEKLFSAAYGKRGEGASAHPPKCRVLIPCIRPTLPFLRQFILSLSAPRTRADDIDTLSISQRTTTTTMQLADVLSIGFGVAGLLSTLCGIHQERTFVAKMELTLLSRWLCKKTQWTRTPYQHEHASPARPTISWPSTTVIVRRRHGLVTPICRLDFLMTDIRGVRGLT
jgi:hypothetical protein